MRGRAERRLLRDSDDRPTRGARIRIRRGSGVNRIFQSIDI
jgi:hypothetical protein